MKYMAIIDADEKPVSCEFIECNGNVAPYLIGATTNIKTLEQEPILDKIRAEIERKKQKINLKRLDAYEKAQDEMRLSTLNEILQIIDKYKAESEDEQC